MKNMSGNVLLEKDALFSESVLWHYQRDYFQRQGINAWAGQVPFYITSNPFIGAVYAKIIAAFLQDLVAQQRLNREEPIYILELGTGSGRFSYYCMKVLFDMMPDLPICYVMSDFTDNNVHFWETQEALAPYFAAGKLDVGIFNMEQDESITLRHSGKVLSPQSLSNPLIVLGNYIFDTVSQDAFRVENQQLHRLLTSVETESSNVDGEGQPLHLEKLKTTFHADLNAIAPFYTDLQYNIILENYRHCFNKANFLLPVGGLRTLKTLASWIKPDVHQPLLLISTDKGYNAIEELEGLSYPGVVFHGSFSMMVNFHAIGEYFKHNAGDAFHQSERRATRTSVFLWGEQFASLPQTQRCLKDHVEDFGPGDFFNVHEHMKATFKDTELKMLASYLSLTCWDPHTYHYLAESINKAVEKNDEQAIQSVLNGMPKLHDNIYWMPGTYDTFFEMGTFFHTCKDYGKALHCYQESLSHAGESSHLFHNMGLCHYFLGDKDAACAGFQRALELDPAAELTREWLGTATAM